MKGITPVIAAILLLIIAISMAGFLSVWFQRITTTVTNATEKNVLYTVNTQEQTVRIDSVTLNSVTLRGTGKQSVLNTNLQVYINNVRVNSCSWDGAAVAPGGLLTCTFPGGVTCSPIGTILKVTGPAGADQTTCP